MNNDLGDTNSTIINNITTALSGTLLSSDIAANATSLTFTNDAITTDSLIDIYSSVYTVIPTNATISSNTLTLTFSNNHVASTIKVVIK